MGVNLLSLKIILVLYIFNNVCDQVQSEINGFVSPYIGFFGKEEFILDNDSDINETENVKRSDYKPYQTLPYSNPSPYFDINNAAGFSDLIKPTNSKNNSPVIYYEDYDINGTLIRNSTEGFFLPQPYPVPFQSNFPPINYPPIPMMPPMLPPYPPAPIPYYPKPIYRPKLKPKIITTNNTYSTPYKSIHKHDYDTRNESTIIVAHTLLRPFQKPETIIEIYRDPSQNMENVTIRNPENNTFVIETKLIKKYHIHGNITNTTTITGGTPTETTSTTEGSTSWSLFGGTTPQSIVTSRETTTTPKPAGGGLFGSWSVWGKNDDQTTTEGALVFKLLRTTTEPTEDDSVTEDENTDENGNENGNGNENNNGDDETDSNHENDEDVAENEYDEDDNNADGYTYKSGRSYYKRPSTDRLKKALILHNKKFNNKPDMYLPREYGSNSKRENSVTRITKRPPITTTESAKLPVWLQRSYTTPKILSFSYMPVVHTTTDISVTEKIQRGPSIIPGLVTPKFSRFKTTTNMYVPVSTTPASTTPISLLNNYWSLWRRGSSIDKR